jgi:hypothetical protein
LAETLFMTRALLLWMIGCSQSPSISEDFEAFTVGDAPSGPWQATGDMEVTDARTHRGAKSLHLRPGPNWEGRALISRSDIPAELRDAHHGRALFYVPEVSASGVHWNMVTVSGETQMAGVWEDRPFQASLSYGGMHEASWLANFDTPGGWDGTGPKSDCWQDSRVPFPENRWVCVEWEVDADAQQMRLWVDGESIPEMTVRGEGDGCVVPWSGEGWAFPTVETLELGWVEFGDAAASRELWIDDIAMDRHRIGCP